MSMSDWRNHMAIQWFAFTHAADDPSAAPQAAREELDNKSAEYRANEEKAS